MCGFVPGDCSSDDDGPAGLLCQNICPDGTCAGQCLPDDTSDTDGDGWGQTDGDCDDTNSVVHPDATEVCDELDNNCNGQIDEECASQECGGLLGKTCPPGEYCRFAVGVCSSAQPDGTCTPYPTECADVFFPVCGCDIHTYTSDCAAAAKKVGVMKKGPCSYHKCKDLSGVDFGDCQTSMGYGVVNGGCEPITGCSCGIHCDALFTSWSTCEQQCKDLVGQ